MSLWFSMQTAVLLTIAIAATMVLGVVPAVYATTNGPPENTKNDFGEDASQDLATDKADDGRSEMGEHSSDPAPGKRSGLGNVFDQGKPDDDPNTSKHPSDVGNTLCDLFPSNDACVDEDD